MAESPLVSVIIPCFNARPMLQAALESVIGQTYPNIEVIFVDNNSTDGSVALARNVAAASPRPFTVTACATQGPNPARNFGYGLARGDYVQWFDADDVLGPEKIEGQVASLERDRGAALAYCDWVARVSPRGLPPVENVHELAQCDDQILRVLTGEWYPPHAYLIRREAADELQREAAWWPQRRVGTDMEYSATAAFLGLRFRHVAGPRVVYNVWSEAQISGRGTSYDLRIAQLRDIYARLDELAARPDVAVRLKAVHRRLLAQDWNAWSMPPRSVAIERAGGRLVHLRHRPSGRVLKAKPREAAVAKAMMELGLVQAIKHHAGRIASHEPRLAGDIPFIMETLERFRREGLLTLEIPVAPPT